MGRAYLSFPDHEVVRWYAIRVKPRHEKSVSRFLEGGGHEWFLPLLRKKHFYGNRQKISELPVFAGYIFCQFNFAARLPILKTPGVIDIVGVGGKPIPIDDDEIASLQKAAKAQLVLEPCMFLQNGTKALITAGPLSGAEGIVVRTKESVR
ncbi:MAG TPA: transcription termination/antitermination NusG family protein, partial [Candidatus Saccharimonadales bacterium]|nr:transcription termination/antitermination NusG family protein [Candidatus Saccharimonadales bacterium]